MKKIINLKYITIWIGLLIIAFTNKAQASTGKVSTETLNLRSEASTNSSIVELLNFGEEIEIISEEGNWYKIKHKDKEGYVSKDYVTVEEPTTTSNNENEQPTESNQENNSSEPNSDVTANTTIKLDKDVTIKILPLINSNDLGTAKAGEEITLITTANNWMFVQTNEIAGWIVKDQTVGQTIQNVNNNNDNTQDESEGDNSENNVDNNSESNTENTEENEKNYAENVTKYVSASSVYMRAEPSTSSDIVTSLIKNTDVTVTGESGDWYKVKFNDFIGYIYKDLLSDNKIEETNRSNSNRPNATQVENVSEDSNVTSNIGNEIVEYAKQYLGCPYVYGGSGSQSFDCSGFTMYVYKHFGYSLSHSATAQSKMGEYVAKENLQPGDLVFFLDYETMDGIGHCGIYIGDGNFIHASSGSGYCVKISTLLSGSYYNRYATARRLI